MKKLDALKTTVDQARDSVEKSQTKDIFVQKKQNRRPRDGEELFAEPAPPLRLIPEQRRRQFPRAFFALQPYSRVPIGILIVLADVARKGLDVVMEERVLQLCGLAADYHVLMHFHVCHGSILVFQAALKPAFTAAEKRKLVKARATMT